MSQLQTIQLDLQKTVATVTMNRPELHNAFNPTMIAELTAAFEQLQQNSAIHTIILQANGSSFSAGADLNWMKSMVNADQQQNQQDSEQLAKLMRAINFNSKTTIAKIQGMTLGGGVGLACCCDLVIAETTAQFGLTEAKLGLVPAVISPYVIDAIGHKAARRYFQSAEIFDAQTAQQLGIVSIITEPEQIDQQLQQQLKLLQKAAPNAKQIGKKLAMSISGRTPEQQQKIDQYTTQLIAAVRVSEEGQKGLNAFLNKQKINW